MEPVVSLWPGLRELLSPGHGDAGAGWRGLIASIHFSRRPTNPVSTTRPDSMRRVVTAGALPPAPLTPCSDASTVAPRDIAGSYALRSIGATSIPGTYLGTSGYTLRVLAGSLALNADGTYVELTVYERTSDGATTTEERRTTGAYTLDGDSITLAPITADHRPVRGSLHSSGITLRDRNDLRVYDR